MKTLQNLVIVQLPKRLDCFVGAEKLNLEGGSICAIYDDGTFEIVPMSPDKMEVDFSSDREGPSLVTLRYEGKEVLFQIHIRMPIVRKFIVTQRPAKTEYLSGEQIDLTGLELDAEYETGERVRWKDIPSADYKIKAGDAVYPLSIQGVTVPIYIKVTQAKVARIRMGKLPNKVEYLERKEAFDPSGGTVIKVFDGGAEEEEPLRPNMVRGFSNLEPGPLTLTVQIGSMTTTFDVKIRAKMAQQLNVLSEPLNVTYIEGQDIDMAGLRLSATFDNGESRIVDDYTFTPRVAALDTVAVRVLVGSAYVDIPIGVSPRQITGIEMVKLPDQTKYLEKRDQLVIDGAVLRVNYDFGDSDELPITREMAHGFDNREAGECQIEVQYKGFLTQFNVQIIPQKLVGLLISKMPVKTQYAPGESFDRTGMQVQGFYDNGLLQVVNSYMVSPDRPLQLGDVAIMIISMDKSAVVPIQVSEEFRPAVVPDVEWAVSVPEKPEPPQEPSLVQDADWLPAPDPEPILVSTPEPKSVPEPIAVTPPPVTSAPVPAPKPQSQKKESFFANRFYPSSSKLRDFD